MYVRSTQANTVRMLKGFGRVMPVTRVHTRWVMVHPYVPTDALLQWVRGTSGCIRSSVHRRKGMDGERYASIVWQSPSGWSHARFAG